MAPPSYEPRRPVRRRRRPAGLAAAVTALAVVAVPQGAVAVCGADPTSIDAVMTAAPGFVLESHPSTGREAEPVPAPEPASGPEPQPAPVPAPGEEVPPEPEPGAETTPTPTLSIDAGHSLSAVTPEPVDDPAGEVAMSPPPIAAMPDGGSRPAAAGSVGASSGGQASRGASPSVPAPPIVTPQAVAPASAASSAPVATPPAPVAVAAAPAGDPGPSSAPVGKAPVHRRLDSPAAHRADRAAARAGVPRSVVRALSSVIGSPPVVSPAPPRGRRAVSHRAPQMVVGMRTAARAAVVVSRSPWMSGGLLLAALLYLLGQRAMDRGAKLSYAGRPGEPDDELIEL